MKARDYISAIVEQIEQGNGSDCSATRAAFVSAALAIIEVVDSPRREQALVSLASLSLAHVEQASGHRKKAA